MGRCAQGAFRCSSGTNELEPLGLTEEEIDDLVAFLEALEGPGPAAHLLSAPSQ